MPSAPDSSTPTLPGFKVTLTAVGGVFMVLGGSMVARGAAVAMAPFGVPVTTLESPHFADFFHFTFVHMVVLGVMLVMLGRFVREGRDQQVVARVLLLVQLHYTWLDLRTSDSPLGNALYQGPASLGPVVIDLLVVVAWTVLSVRRVR
jgi:hypothetical protein